MAASPSTSNSSTPPVASSTKSPTDPRSDVLVIGYGNEIRSDDGVGPRIARRLDAAAVSGLRALALHQLTPELAEPIAAAAAVIFVDASVTMAPGQVELTPISPDSQPDRPGHHSNPRSLLALTRTLFDRTPSAWMISIGVGSLDFGEQLSPEVEAAIPKTLEIVRSLIPFHFRSTRSDRPKRVRRTRVPAPRRYPSPDRP